MRDFINSVRATETSHNGDFTVTIEGHEILRCGMNYNPSSEFIGHYESGAGTSVYNLATLAAAAEARLIVAPARLMRSQSVGRDIFSVTIAGVEMAPIVHLVAGDPGPSANAAVTQGIYYLLVPAGVTGDVIVTSAGNAAGAAIDLFALTGLASNVPFDSAQNSSNGSNPATSIDIPFNGILIASYAGVGGTPGAAVWTGINSLQVNEVHEPGTWWGSSGLQTGMAEQAGRTVSVTAAASGYESVVAAAFG